MAHYAFLDENNIVTKVIVGIDEGELIEGLDPETWYANFMGQTCKRTSYNTQSGAHSLGGVAFRKNFASIGYTYDEGWDAFRAPQPFPSWKLDYDKFIWVSPVPMPEPEEGYVWKWGELNQEWIKLATPTE
jgi:hypothetical protein